MARNRYDDEDDDRDDDRPRRRRRRDDDRPAKKKSGNATLWIVLGIVGGVLLVCGGGVVAVVVTIGNMGLPNRAAQNNLKQLGLATHSHADQMDALPTAFTTTDDAGRTITPPANESDRLSWRVTLLRYIPEENGRRQFDYTQPWTGPVNLPHASSVVRCYADPASPTDPKTAYRAFYDNGAIFSSDPRAKTRMTGITDGTSNTILYVEANETVTWTQFNDFKFNPGGPLPPLGRGTAGFQVVMADGSIRFVRKSVSEAAIKAAITKDGGEVMLLD